MLRFAQPASEAFIGLYPITMLMHHTSGTIRTTHSFSHSAVPSSTTPIPRAQLRSVPPKVVTTIRGRRIHHIIHHHSLSHRRFFIPAFPISFLITNITPHTNPSPPTPRRTSRSPTPSRPPSDGQMIVPKRPKRIHKPNKVTRQNVEPCMSVIRVSRRGDVH